MTPAHQNGNRSDSERGAVIIVTAISLMVLLFVAAVAVDLGYARQVDVQAQNAVDSAALAALYQVELTSDAQVIQAARDYVTSNGFDGTAAIVDYPYTDPLGRTCIGVEVTEPVGTFFARVMGVDVVNVSARAVGCSAPVSTGIPYAVAGLSQSCATSGNSSTVNLDGSGFDIVGSVHSNFDMLTSSSNGSVDGLVTYAGTLTDDDSDNFDPVLSSTILTPDDVLNEVPVFADYLPGGSKANAAMAEPNVVPGWPGRYYLLPNEPIDGPWLIANGLFFDQAGEKIMAPGLYVMPYDQEIKIDSSGSGGAINQADVSIISHGAITIHNSDAPFQPWDSSGLLFYTDKSTACYDADDIAISLHESSGSYTGAIYASNGFVEVHGSGSKVVDGTVMGQTVEIHGSNAGISANTSFGKPAEKMAQLVE